jgi:hypothetical protein
VAAPPGDGGATLAALALGRAEEAGDEPGGGIGGDLPPEAPAAAAEEEGKMRMREENLLGTPKAAELLGISPEQFRRLAKKVGLSPAGWYLNPHYRSGPPCPLWRPEDVERLRLEAGAWLERAAARSAAAKKAADMKRERTMKKAKALIRKHLRVPAIPLDKLAALAAKHKRLLDFGRDAPTPVFRPWDEDDPFRDRVCVNFLRHECTNYDYVLSLLEGRVGKREARLLLFEAFVDQVCELYPVLAEEAERQLLDRIDEDTLP